MKKSGVVIAACVVVLLGAWVASRALSGDVTPAAVSNPNIQTVNINQVIEPELPRPISAQPTPQFDREKVLELAQNPGQVRPFARRVRPLRRGGADAPAMQRRARRSNGAPVAAATRPREARAAADLEGRGPASGPAVIEAAWRHPLTSPSFRGEKQSRSRPIFAFLVDGGFPSKRFDVSQRVSWMMGTPAPCRPASIGRKRQRPLHESLLDLGFNEIQVREKVTDGFNGVLAFAADVNASRGDARSRRALRSSASRVHRAAIALRSWWRSSPAAHERPRERAAVHGHRGTAWSRAGR